MNKVLPLRKSFSLSVILHIVLLAALVVSFTFAPKTRPPLTLNLQQADKIVQAVSVNQTQVEQEVAKLQNQQAQQAAAQKAKLAAMQQQAAAAAKLKAQQEQQLAKLKAQQQAAVEQQKAQLAKLQQQQQQAQKQLAAIQQNAQKAKTQQQNLKKELQQTAEKNLQQQLAQEATQLDAQKNQQINDEIAKYGVLIQQAISQKWIIPANSNRNLYCWLDISLAADGTVTKVFLTQSSGDSALDQSAITAVYKASPLPVPTDPAVFKQMQEIKLKVQPQAVS
jgi:colicin import membrane protein